MWHTWRTTPDGRNICILGIRENTEGPQPTAFIVNLLLKVFGEETFNLLLSVDRAHRSTVPKPSGKVLPCVVSDD